MIIQSLLQIFERDLKRLKEEIASYEDVSAMWEVKHDIKNSGGNLCLHLVGNLNTYIGLGLGQIPYERNRELEFSQKGLPKDELLKLVGDCAARVNSALNGLEEEMLERDFPMLVFENKTTTGYMLVHLAAHLSYHLGQINYHRRLLDRV